MFKRQREREIRFLSYKKYNSQRGKARIQKLPSPGDDDDEDRGRNEEREVERRGGERRPS